MIESIANRVARIIAGNAHAIIDRLEDQSPTALLNQSMRQIEEIASEIGAQLGLVITQRHTTQRQYGALNGEHESLSTSIDLALTGGKEDLARAGVARQIDIESQLPILEASLVDLGAKEKELKGLAEGLLAKKNEMQSTIDHLSNTPRAGNAPVGLPAVQGSIESRIGQAEGSFDRTLSRHAGAALAGASVTHDDGAQLRALGTLTRDHKIQERLAELKTGQR